MLRETTAFLIACCVFTSGSFAQGADSVTWVAYDDPIPGPPIGSIEENPSALRLSSASNWICDLFDQCPEGAAIITTDGAYSGCATDCTGTCTRCSGSDKKAHLCVIATGESCDFATSLTRCGTKGVGDCFTAGEGEGDNNGCGCSIPAYYGTLNCTLVNCLYVADP